MTLADDSKRLYNQLGEDYLRLYAKERQAYLDTIDSIIVATAPHKGAMLDIGSGDGVRAADLCKRLEATKLVMLDNSEKMVEASKRYGESRLISIEDFYEFDAYDVVTCLWNVFGHVERKQEALRHIALSLRCKGRAFLDVNNRHNAAEYGFRNALRNLWGDIIGKDTGYFKTRNFGTEVYLHGFCELDRLFGDAGLSIVDKLFVDYKTGKICSPFSGQILYVLKLT